MSLTQTYIGTMNAVTCSECGVTFGLDSDHQAAVRRNRSTFYCPNGHSQWYPGKTDAKVAQEALDTLARVRASHDQTLAALADAEKRGEVAARKLKRVHRGVCPSCNRTFLNLARHMKCKHMKKQANK